MNVFDVDDNNHITGLITKIRNLYREFLSLDVAERGAGTSFLDFIKYSIRSKASTDGLTLSMRAATFAAKALNLALSMAVGALIGMAINGVISAIADYAQRIDTAATKTKEAADAANNTTSSLKDLVDAYEELGDKSGWSTEDFDQAKDIQEELLALAKEQGTLDENKANQLDLQNGKYEEQLGLLKDITEEQLKASESKLIQSKDAQGNKLIKTAKDNNRSHFFSSVSANTNRGIMNELKDAGIDVFNKNGSFGAKDLNDPDSIAKYYSELGRALDYIVQNTTEAQRAAGGAYNTVYKYLIDEQSALRDDVDSYNDSTDAVNENVNARRKLQAIDFWSDGKSNGINKNQFATAGHNHDSRYYTESEIDSKLDGKSNVGHTHDYLPTAGGTMNGTITFSDSSHGKIYSGPTDNVNGPGGDLNNIVIESWNGLSFTTGCPNQTYTGKTAVGIDCREGVVKAARFDGTLTGTAATLGGGGNPNAPMTFNWSGKDGQPTWLWGGEDGTNMYVYNPGNFSVNWAQGAANGVYANGFKSSRGGYIRFCNGLQICWGENNKNTTAAVFDVPFKTVDYTLVLGGTDDLNNAWYIASRTTTGFTPKQNGFAGVTNWIAIGRWN